MECEAKEKFRNIYTISCYLMDSMLSDGCQPETLSPRPSLKLAVRCGSLIEIQPTVMNATR